MANEEEYFEDEDVEELEEVKPGPVRKFLQNLLTGTAIGAGIGGAGGYYGAQYLRDLALYGAAPNSWTPGPIRELNFPTETARAVTVPSGALAGGLLGAIGGVTLPYIFQKRGNELNSKYANEFLDKVKNELMALKPFNQSDALLKIAPITAILGSMGGGLLAALKKPDLDEEGNPKSKTPSVLRGIGLGAILGGTAGALTPTIGTFAAQKSLPSMVQYAKNKLKGNEDVEALTRSAVADSIGKNLINRLPETNVGQLLNYYNAVAGKY